MNFHFHRSSAVDLFKGIKEIRARYFETSSLGSKRGGGFDCNIGILFGFRVFFPSSFFERINYSSKAYFLSSILKTHPCNPFRKPFIVKHVDHIAGSSLSDELNYPSNTSCFLHFSVNCVEHNNNLFKVST